MGLPHTTCPILLSFRLDKGNRCVLWTDAHTGAVVRAQHQFLHNTKIARSAINERKAHEKSRSRGHPVGRFMPLPQMLHQLLGEVDIYTNIPFKPISVAPLEYRPNVKIRLTKDGKVQGPEYGRVITPDTSSPLTDSCSIRKVRLPVERHFSVNQCLLIQPSPKDSKTSSDSSAYNDVALFGLRPVELVELFPKLDEYYEWFEVSKRPMKRDDISKGLHVDVTRCQWIDGLGRRVRLRNGARKPARDRLTLMERQDVRHDHSWQLRGYLMNLLDSDEECSTSMFVSDDGGRMLPIPVFSRASPNRSTAFLLHIMLVLGEYETELDFKCGTSMKGGLAKVKLLPADYSNDRVSLEEYSNSILRRVILEILPVQPVSMNKLEEFIIKTKQLLDSVLQDDSIPMTDLPPCILTELLNDKSEEMQQVWTDCTKRQVDSMLKKFPVVEGVTPSREELCAMTKSKAKPWDIVGTLRQDPLQSDESFREQKLALSYGVNAVDSYCQQFSKTTYTRGIINNGAPGAGKTFVLQAQGLYGLSRGLRVMSTSLMAVRANALGGYHLHRLFQWQVRNGNIFRLAEVSQ